MFAVGVSSASNGAKARPSSLVIVDSSTEATDNGHKECLSPQVKYNEELNGYHFTYFKEQFICREQLPRGSMTFQQVFEEITNEVNEINVSESPKPLPVKSRRMSVASMIRRPVNAVFSAAKSEKTRRVSWGKPTYFQSEVDPNFARPRVCSDGAVVLKKSQCVGGPAR